MRDATERVDEFLALIRECGGTAAALEEIERRAVAAVRRAVEEQLSPHLALAHIPDSELDDYEARLLTDDWVPLGCRGNPEAIRYRKSAGEFQRLAYRAGNAIRRALTAVAGTEVRHG